VIHLLLVGSVCAQEPAESQRPAEALSAPSAAEPGSHGEEAEGYMKLPPVSFRPEYRPVGWLDFALTGTFGSATIISRIVGPRTDGPRGQGSLDEGTRSALRAPSVRGRILAADVSDVILGASVTYALLGDALVNAAWLRRSPEVGKQVFWMSAEVLAVTLGVQQLTSNFVGRERPYGPTCGSEELPEDTHRCQTQDRYRSFFSGHTSVPFSMAAASCTHHVYLGLSGDGAWLHCSAAFLAAAASGTMRMVADYHYATDVITGALVGTSIGTLIPLIHYTTGTQPFQSEVAGVRLQLVPTWGGLSVSGVMW